MIRIDTDTRRISLFGDGKDGFTDGDPAAGVPATRLNADWFNGVQEEIVGAIEAAGLVPQAGDYTQLTQAIRALSATAPVRQPKNVSPAAGATGLGETPTLTASPYYSLYGLPQGAGRFELSQSPNFTTVVHGNTLAGAATAYTVPAGVLAVNSVYWWRVRYQDAEGNWSLWSAPTGFTTGSVFTYVAQPSISSPANNASGVSTTPTFTYSAFQIVGGTDTHDATQVQVATDAGFTNVIHDSGVAGQPSAAYTVPAASAFPTLYILYVRVRHHAVGLGWSQWSEAVRFQVQARPAAPVITSPAAGATGVSLTPTITTSGFSVPGGADSHVASQYQTATTSGFTAIQHDSGAVVSLTSYGVPAGAGLVPLTTYYLRARHQGATTGWSDWSPTVAFTTATPAGEQSFTTPGAHEYIVPAGITSVSVVCVGASGGSKYGGGGGGGLRWKNNIAVTPGQAIPVTVGAPGVSGIDPTPGGSSSFGGFVTAYGGGASTGTAGGIGGGGIGGNGGNGGNGGRGREDRGGGGGGAGGYAAPGLNGQDDGYYIAAGAGGSGGVNGSGGAGGTAGGDAGNGGGGGGGIGLAPTIQGAAGAGTAGSAAGGHGGTYGGAPGGSRSFTVPPVGGSGAVRVIWGPGATF